MKMLKLFVILLLGLLLTWNVVAEPTGPSSITPGPSSRYPVTTASNTSAIAGNVTELTFQADSVTKTWQGYYGNISGSIKLGDVNNNTMYDWTTASPNGEIYATQSGTTPTWASIACADSTEINAEDTALGVNQSVDQDSVNRTFLNTTAFNDFYVGSVSINSTQNCYAVNLHDETGNPSSDFQELVLSDGSAFVYAALIKQDTTSFNGNPYDFEMIVGENGHGGDTNPTLYYFYVELG